MKSGLVLLFLVTVLAYAVADTIIWKGSNSAEWSLQQNWNPARIPNMNDNVIIPNGRWPSGIVVGINPASCKNLTIAGGEHLVIVVNNEFKVGTGGITIGKNVVIKMETDKKFSSEGPVTFADGSLLSFSTGVLSGKGSWNVHTANFSAPGRKSIDGKVTIGNLNANPAGSIGNIDVVSTSGGQFNVNNADITGGFIFHTEKDGQFKIQGQLKYTNAGSRDGLLFDGNIQITNVFVDGGYMQILQSVEIGKLDASGNLTLDLVGGPDQRRSIGSLSGAVTIRATGGALNVLSAKIPSLQINGATVVLKEATISHVDLRGGELQGPGDLTTSQLSITGGVISAGLTVSVSGKAFASRPFSIDSSTITFGGSTDLNAVITMLSTTGATKIEILEGASVTQSGAVTFVQGGQPPVKAILAINGNWVATDSFEAHVAVTGTGSLSVKKSSVTADDQFALASVALAAGTKFEHANKDLTLGKLTGSGDVIIRSNTFTVTGETSAKSIAMRGGKVMLETAFEVDTMILAGSRARIVEGSVKSTLRLEGGHLEGAESSSITAGAVELGGDSPTTLENVDIKAEAFGMSSCKSGECQLFTKKATITINN